MTRHCANCESQARKIIELKGLLAYTVNMAELYGEDTGLNFSEAMASARAAALEARGLEIRSKANEHQRIS